MTQQIKRYENLGEIVRDCNSLSYDELLEMDDVSEDEQFEEEKPKHSRDKMLLNAAFKRAKLVHVRAAS